MTIYCCDRCEKRVKDRNYLFVNIYRSAQCRCNDGHGNDYFYKEVYLCSACNDDLIGHYKAFDTKETQ